MLPTRRVFTCSRERTPVVKMVTNSIKKAYVGLCKGFSVGAPLPAELQARLLHNLINQVWNELDYKADVCRILNMYSMSEKTLWAFLCE